MAMIDITLSNRAPRALGSLFSYAAKVAQTHRQRSALRRLDEAALKDLGLTRAQVDAEANRAIWDLPNA